ncbi:hypothetical protein HMPREF0044_1278 [Gleimia coleocanis DSM 15436]|uniref:DUF881 domain-containing protein n=1 Tax=Gleimia coleocanis DSM 15436 TaxID=525245 RepID=C0W1I8_9ACTO|nr:DUF881 domain-containing protein [Gleimia coleocanis]EEH63354.1 hypothetical protein HMPREF0044_1278 [Gleimia coleocanis DSM 15436]
MNEHKSEAPVLVSKFKGLLTAKFRPAHLLVAFLCFVLGWAMVTQIKLQRTDPLDTLQESELVALLDQLSVSDSQLREERAALAVEAAKLKDERSKVEAAEQAVAREREAAQIAAGVVPVQGPGLIITVTDAQNKARVQNFITVLGELRNSGAEAVSLNGIRLTASTYIEKNGNGILVSGQPISSPYIWKVIGDADTIQPAMEIARGAAQQLRTRGATVSYERAELVEILEVATVKPNEHATTITEKPRG